MRTSRPRGGSARLNGTNEVAYGIECLHCSRWFKSLHLDASPSRPCTVSSSIQTSSYFVYLYQSTVIYQVLSTVFIRLPYWIVIYVPKHWRPRPSWSLKRSVMVCF